MAKHSKLIWGLKLLFKLISSKNDKIYISCGPYWAIPIVWFVGKLKKKKLIYDFRDPWSFNIEIGYGDTNKIGHAYKIILSKYIEKAIYNDCYNFWVCTPGMYDLYANLFQNNEKLKLVPNGYEITKNDLSQTSNNKHRNNSNTITFVCIGRIVTHGLEPAWKLFRKIKDYIENEPTKFIHINLIGTEQYELDKIISELNLVEYVTFLPKQDRLVALEMAANSDVGICIVRDEEIYLGTKAFDYIGLGLPIFDVFDHTKNFYKYFKKYLVGANELECIHKYEPPPELDRNYIFSSALKYI